jgi:hypothetical protein
VNTGGAPRPGRTAGRTVGSPSIRICAALPPPGGPPPGTQQECPVRTKNRYSHAWYPTPIMELSGDCASDASRSLVCCTQLRRYCFGTNMSIDLRKRRSSDRCTRPARALSLSKQADRR